MTTTDPAPTTAAPPDDVEETSSSPAGDATETTEASGPPQMPDEAKEDSESGAEAFALHYVDLINYTSRHPEVGLLEPLGADGCKSCVNHEDSVAYSQQHQETLAKDLFLVAESISLHNPSASTATVRVAVEQIGQDVTDGAGDVVDRIESRTATMVFTLTWTDAWQVDEIQVQLEGQ
nr:DUF6318 family protein [Ornithinimicrobium cryptoxanthini]